MDKKLENFQELESCFSFLIGSSSNIQFQKYAIVRNITRWKRVKFGYVIRILNVVCLIARQTNEWKIQPIRPCKSNGKIIS